MAHDQRRSRARRPDDLGPVLDAVGPRLRALRVERGTTLAAALGDDRHLGEHAVAAGVRRAQADARAAAAAGPRPPGRARRARRRARDGRPAGPAQAAPPVGDDAAAADAAARRAAGVQDDHAAEPARAAAGAADARGLRVALRPVRPDPAPPRAARPRCSRPARSRSSTRGRRTGSATRVPARPSSSRCSARRANACTSGRGRSRAERTPAAPHPPVRCVSATEVSARVGRERTLGGVEVLLAAHPAEEGGVGN